MPDKDNLEITKIIDSDSIQWSANELKALNIILGIIDSDIFEIERRKIHFNRNICIFLHRIQEIPNMTLKELADLVGHHRIERCRQIQAKFMLRINIYLEKNESEREIIWNAFPVFRMYEIRMRKNKSISELREKYETK